MSDMEKRTANLILLNSCDEVLLQLRDNISTIPYPNMWCLPGGHIEPNETPEECLAREMYEEMGIELEHLSLFAEKRYPDETEYFFVSRKSFDARDIKLTEGQAIAWFSRDAVQQLDMAHNDGKVIEEFYNQSSVEKAV